MSSYSTSNNSYVNSVIGEGSSFKGDIRTSGLLRIDGDLKGNIEANGKVLIGKNGRVESNIFGETIVIGGAVKGNVTASQRVVILSSAVMLGNIKSPRFEIEEGVIINGKCIIANKKLSESDIDQLNSNKNKKIDIMEYNPTLQK
ncbi:MAG: polymer-forming cytoskeletal protein [Spirochaetales bacterium]|nr:polymer-forming cytoskeletal protein [Spirochaetales bacterium]